MKLIAFALCKLCGAFPFARVGEVCRHRSYVFLVAWWLCLFLRLHLNPYRLVHISSFCNCDKVNEVASYLVRDFVKVLYRLVLVVPLDDVRVLVKIHHAEVLKLALVHKRFMSSVLLRM